VLLSKGGTLSRAHEILMQRIQGELSQKKRMARQPECCLSKQVELFHSLRYHYNTMRYLKILGLCLLLHGAARLLWAPAQPLERHEHNGITYFVTGGGGAHAYSIERAPSDLFQARK
jgi:hypothetical protein